MPVKWGTGRIRRDTSSRPAWIVKTRRFAPFELQVVLAGLFHHLRYELGAGYALGKPGVILYPLNIFYRPPEAVFLQDDDPSFGPSQIKGRRQSGRAAANNYYITIKQRY